MILIFLSSYLNKSRPDVREALQHLLFWLQPFIKFSYLSKIYQCLSVKNTTTIYLIHCTNFTLKLTNLLNILTLHQKLYFKYSR